MLVAWRNTRHLKYLIVMNTTRVLAPAVASVMWGVVSLGAIGCFDTAGSGSLAIQVELRFFETTPDSGYVRLNAVALGGIAANIALNCTGFLPLSGTSPLNDATSVEKGPADQVVSETCTASAGDASTQGGASTVIPARPAPQSFLP